MTHDTGYYQDLMDISYVSGGMDMVAKLRTTLEPHILAVRDELYKSHNSYEANEAVRALLDWLENTAPKPEPIDEYVYQPHIWPEASPGVWVDKETGIEVEEAE